MPITLDQIIEETRHWPPEKIGELVDRLTEDLHTGDPEVARRIADIQSGKVQGIPGEKVSAHVRKIVGRCPN